MADFEHIYLVGKDISGADVETDTLAFPGGSEQIFLGIGESLCPQRKRPSRARGAIHRPAAVATELLETAGRLTFVASTTAASVQGLQDKPARPLLHSWAREAWEGLLDGGSRSWPSAPQSLL